MVFEFFCGCSIVTHSDMNIHPVSKIILFYSVRGVIIKRVTLKNVKHLYYVN